MQTTYGKKCRFFHHDDFSGNIHIADKETGDTIVEVPFEDIKTLFAAWVRSERGARLEGNADVSLQCNDFSGNVAVVDNAMWEVIAQVPFAQMKALVALWVHRTRSGMDDDTILLGYPPPASCDE